MSTSDPPKARPKPGPWPPAPDSAPEPPSSWAKRTGFRPKFSGESNVTDSGQITFAPPQPDLEPGRTRNTSTASTANATPATPAAAAPAVPPSPAGNGESDRPTSAAAAASSKDQRVKRRKESDKGLNVNGNGNGNGNGSGPAGQQPDSNQQQQRRASRNEDVVVDGMDDDGFLARTSHMKYNLRDSPGLGEIC